MLQFLYPLSFIVSLSGLILWFYHEGNPKRSRLMSQAFLGGFLVYLCSLGLSNGDLSSKLWVLFRDLMVLAVVSQGFNFLKNNKVLFFGGLSLLYTVFYLFGFQKMAQTFAQAPISANDSKTLTSDGFYGELLVDIADQHQFEELQNLIVQYGLTYEKAFSPAHPEQTELDDYFLVDVSDQYEHQLKEIQEALMASGLVDEVEENEQIQLDPMESFQPNRKGRSFGLNDPEVVQLWGFEAMKVDQLYALVQKNKIKPQRKALIAILDTGVDAQHEDLKANFKSISSRSDKDQAGHGTHCAGIAGAVSNNNKGVASFSMDNNFVEITSVKVLSDFGGGTQQSIINGIIEATDKGADVLSLSLGGPSTKRRQKAYEKAVEYANKAGAIVVVAAGNSNSDAAKYGPANTPGVITVSAIDTTINRANFSNYVSGVKMGIAAPGVQIYSSIPDSKYAAFNGTSMATPYVAGLLGMMKSIQPDLTTEQAYAIINNTGIATGDTPKTGKLIQPGAAINQLIQ